MKRRFLYFTVFCLVSCISFGQDSVAKSFVIKYTDYGIRMPAKGRLTLDSVVEAMKIKPAYYCWVISFYSGIHKLSLAQWDRANSIIDYFVKKKGLDENRFIFSHRGYDCDCNEIRIALTEEGPDTTSRRPPHPNLRRKAKDSTVRGANQ